MLVLDSEEVLERLELRLRLLRLGLGVEPRDSGDFALRFATLLASEERSLLDAGDAVERPLERLRLLRA